VRHRYTWDIIVGAALNILACVSAALQFHVTAACFTVLFYVYLVRVFSRVRDALRDQWAEEDAELHAIEELTMDPELLEEVALQLELDKVSQQLEESECAKALTEHRYSELKRHYDRLRLNLASRRDTPRT
jgi:hypothetical protein